MLNEQNPKDKNEELIIYHPHALNPLRKGVELTVTTIGWLIWAILCRPLILTLLWFLGFEIFYEHMIRLGGIKALIGFTFIYFGSIFLMYLFIRGWNYYNARKFRKKNKRKNVRNVSAHDLEDYFRFHPDTIEKVQGWKNIVVTLQENHQISLTETTSLESETYKGYFKSG